MGGALVATSQPGLGAWATQLQVTARAARYAVGSLLAPAGGFIMAWANGVLPSLGSGPTVLDLRVVPDDPTPSLSLRCYPGQCVISRTGQGPYLCTLDETGRFTLDDADSANPR